MFLRLKERLIITRMRKFVLEGNVISGSNIGEKVFIPRSQEQSLKSVGIYLSGPVFSHGQLYVAISRVTSKQGLKTLIVYGDGENTDTTSCILMIKVQTFF
ncbi:PIF1 helicase, putative [Medicago truncatula]|uniref:PIF1 helicase, putative n=1 Tax=Medicago truncatula TaxID=3880 RepID=A0A072UAV8_MEDTR|nr:PIF1 helicase, putative [Medicago truncatula]